eukprot:m.519130 g.519130  ORF g.519130 m.519130 type:complete len:369 (+) comp57488_c0_seq38:2208-3314(+)
MPALPCRCSCTIKVPSLCRHRNENKNWVSHIVTNRAKTSLLNLSLQNVKCFRELGLRLKPRLVELVRDLKLAHRMLWAVEQRAASMRTRAQLRIKQLVIVFERGPTRLDGHALTNQRWIIERPLTVVCVELQRRHQRLCIQRRGEVIDDLQAASDCRLIRFVAQPRDISGGIGGNEQLVERVVARCREHAIFSLGGTLEPISRPDPLAGHRNREVKIKQTADVQNKDGKASASKRLRVPHDGEEAVIILRLPELGEMKRGGEELEEVEDAVKGDQHPHRRPGEACTAQRRSNNSLLDAKALRLRGRGEAHNKLLLQEAHKRIQSAENQRRKPHKHGELAAPIGLTNDQEDSSGKSPKPDAQPRVIGLR